MNILRIHLLVLPRWFGLPFVIAPVMLGAILSGASVLNTLLACLIGALIMSYGHSVNTWLDWLIGFDRGEKKSKPKPYTSGQNVIDDDSKGFGYVVLNSFVWAALALVIAGYLSLIGFRWALEITLVSLLLPFAYSFGKKLYLCETVLAVGFGPLAAVLGAAVSQNPRYLEAALASLPIAIVFGFAAEIWDQSYDSENNWDDGLRNIGAWLVHTYNGVAVNRTVHVFVLIAGVTHLFLALYGVLSIYTLIAAIMYIPFLISLKPTLNLKRAVLLGLAAISVYSLMIPIVQVFA
jgi:4-hydroxybenzoate polyprenyltransferase